MSHSELVITSFLRFLGSPLSFGTGINKERLALFIGAATVGFAALACMRFDQVRREPGMVRRCLPWLTIGGYALATAVIVTLGRATASSQQLLESRYTTFSVYWFVALIFLWPILFLEPHAAPTGWKRWSTEGVIAAFIFLQFFTSLYAIGQMKGTRTDRLEAKACLAFFDLIDDPCQTQRLDWDPIILKRRVQALERLDYFHPAVLRSPDLRLLASSADSSSKQYGVFESLVNVGDGFYRASGWATLPQRAEPADAVVLTYVRADGAAVAFALADWIKIGSRWEKWFELPPGADRIQAWAYDALAGRAFLLFGEQRAPQAPLASVRFLPQLRGYVDSAERSEVITLKGWAALLNELRPADIVLLTCGAGNAIVGAGQVWAIRPDVARALQDERYLKSGWQIPLRPEKLPAGCKLKAWAYDASTNDAGLLTDLTH